MPEYLRALIVILILAGSVLYLAGRNSILVSAQQGLLPQRKRLWLFLTITAFLSQSFWVYAVIVLGVFFSLKSKAYNPAALFYFFLFLLPAASIQIPGLGLINYFFELNHIRLLSLLLLLPAWLHLRKASGVSRFGKLGADRILAAYLVLIAILILDRSLTLTAALRYIFGLFTDTFLPYFVFSRAVQDIKGFKETISSYVIAAGIMGLIAIFEVVRYWLLYASVVSVLGLDWGYSGYLGREGLLRASASAGQPIALGFSMVVAMGFFYFLINGKARGHRVFGALLAGGVIAPLSRGPWLGLASMVLAVVGTGRQALSKLMKLFFATALVFGLLAVLPGGQRIVAFLPFVGSVETGGIDYRQRLIDNSLIVIERNPLFGSANFLETPEMQELMQGQGIIDITNTYLAIALTYGLSGLGLFLGFFLWMMFSIYRCLKKHQDNSEMHLLGQVLIGVLIAILTTLATVSSITVIPAIYWTVAGLAVSYVQLSKSRPV